MTRGEHGRAGVTWTRAPKQHAALQIDVGLLRQHHYRFLDDNARLEFLTCRDRDPRHLSDSQHRMGVSIVVERFRAELVVCERRAMLTGAPWLADEHLTGPVSAASQPGSRPTPLSSLRRAMMRQRGKSSSSCSRCWVNNATFSFQRRPGHIHPHRRRGFALADSITDRDLVGDLTRAR